MKKSFLTLITLATMLLFMGCDATKQQSSGAYNLIKCKYTYNSISNISISGINASNALSLTNITKITSILSGNSSSIPLDFTLNLNVNNPNEGDAILNGMEYALSIDNIQFTTGNIEQALTINAGQTQTLPLTIGVDLATLMQDNSKTAIVDIAKNFLGIGSEKSNVSVQLRPTFKIGNSKITSPVAIPLSFSFGG